MNGRKSSFEDVNLDTITGNGRSLHKSNSFSVDDAFSDGGDDETQAEFTSDFIRKELARNAQNGHSWDAGDGGVEFEDIQIEPSLEDPDASVSTIDIYAPPLHGSLDNPTSIALPPSPESRTSNTHVDAVSPQSLSFRPSPPASSGHHAFPSVVIDLSKPSAQQVTITSDSLPPASELEHPPPHSPNALQSGLPINASSSSSKPSMAPSSSLPLPLTEPKTPTHRSSKSTGPSALEQVISKTRPAYLPPKPKPEDRKHLSDWEAMMKHSRVAEEHKKKARQERRLARERMVEESMTIWEQQILPDWKSAVRDAKLRKMWWNGVPPKLRGLVWEKTVGNALALGKDTYRMCLARALRALSAGTFPTTTLNLIDEDIRTTLPMLHIFTPNVGPLYQDLKDMLCAWVVSRSDEGLGYVLGASKIAAMFLLNMQPANAFVSMRNMLERHCMRSFYGGLAAKEDVEAYYRIFDTLLADYMPKIYFNFKQHQVSPSAYLPGWLMPLFLNHLPLEACARIWDVLVLEGDSFLFRAALAILAVLEPRLFFPDRHELLELLHGENKAALDLARREGRVLGFCKYEIYNIDEDNVWEEIDALEGWWKESTWSRLIQRELPDL